MTLPKRGGGLAGLTGSRAAANGPYDQTFARSPANEVRALIAVWNESAFERRKVKVELRTRAIATQGQGIGEGYELYVEAL